MAAETLRDSQSLFQIPGDADPVRPASPRYPICRVHPVIRQSPCCPAGPDAGTGGAFQPFAFPLITAQQQTTLESVGGTCGEYRRRVALDGREGLTAACGWSDLNPGHSFHATPQGVRCTLSEPARREVLDRLLALNHEPYAEEVRAGLHEKGKKAGKAGKSKRVAKGQMELL